MILNVIMIFAACCAAGAWLVLWSKLDEQKKLTKEERDRRWDEISRAVDLEKQLDCAANAYEDVTGMYRTMSAYSDIVKQERDALQDKLSALLCPRNDHVWKDGCCVKCGRVKDYEAIKEALTFYAATAETTRKTKTLLDAADAIEELLARDVVPTDFHERCLQLEIRKRIELEKQMPHWISVEDEPPKENGRYLVRYKRDVNLGDEETVHEDEIRIMRFFVDDGWRYPIICNDHVRLVNEEVTHWMPLPEPPKEVQDD